MDLKGKWIRRVDIYVLLKSGEKIESHKTFNLPKDIWDLPSLKNKSSIVSLFNINEDEIVTGFIKIYYFKDLLHWEEFIGARLDPDIYEDDFINNNTDFCFIVIKYENRNNFRSYF